MVAKLLLPAYGGSATVWSTSSLFFQVLLLVAYWYAHATTNRFGSRWQPRLHVPLLILPALALPVVLPATAAPPEDSSPILWLLRTLVLMIGLPFAVVATTGPLLQRWYSWTGNARSEDPYFLFAASNLGSFGGLLAYPLLIEPSVSLADQRRLWTWGFAIFAVLCATSAIVALAGARGPRVTSTKAQKRDPIPTASVLRWTLLALLPSSLMLGVTAHLSTDVAAFPLLWVVPLAIYLATFVLAFGKGSRISPRWPTRMAVALGVVAILILVRPSLLPTNALIALNLVLLGAVAYAAHARLAAERPAPEHLTGYFLVIAIGGALGGLLNGVVAPVLFDRVLEYPLALLAVPLLVLGVPALSQGWLQRQFQTNRVRAALVLLAASAAALGFLVPLSSVQESPLLLVVYLSLAFLFALWISALPLVAVVVSLALLGAPLLGDNPETLERARSFYGSYEVTVRDDQHVLSHGTTIHGAQFMDRARSDEPTTYYSSTGPLGDVFGQLDRADLRNVGVVGLGAGTIAAYGRHGQSMTFFEIDQGIVDIARDPRLFTYLENSDAEIKTVVGDGRLRLTESPAGSFDLLVLDAFSSDAIPVHLLTEEAMELYADRLAPGGVLLVHISNRVFDLQPVIAGANEHLGWHGALGSKSGDGDGATPSVWAALSPDPDAIDSLLDQEGWQPLDQSRQVRWTDDYSSILSVMR